MGYLARAETLRALRRSLEQRDAERDATTVGYAAERAIHADVPRVEGASGEPDAVVLELVPADRPINADVPPHELGAEVPPRELP
jgi:hypothetical protein